MAAYTPSELPIWYNRYFVARENQRRYEIEINNLRKELIPSYQHTLSRSLEQYKKELTTGRFTVSSHNDRIERQKAPEGTVVKSNNNCKPVDGLRPNISCSTESSKTHARPPKIVFPPIEETFTYLSNKKLYKERPNQKAKFNFQVKESRTRSGKSRISIERPVDDRFVGYKPPEHLWPGMQKRVWKNMCKPKGGERGKECLQKFYSSKEDLSVHKVNIDVKKVKQKTD
ncbi:uncharacterized protein LOC117124759 [Anneissia japonica]|uniref:uncharacterized protein LOC117124759 n=1 Tax=Anneissia japonica TaxID=1529436 RepID=UPI0014255D46|nr:uncharacterized protein LOC117124759 [Anneissia japonica]